MTPASASVRARRRRARHENLVEAFSAIARAVPTGHVETEGGVTIVQSGLDTSGFNIVYALDRPLSTNRLERRIEETFTRRGIPWHLTTTPAISPALRGLIRRFHLTQHLVHPAFVWTRLPDTVPPVPDGLDIRPVRTAEQVRSFASTAAEGFGEPSGTLDPWAEGAIAALQTGSSPSGLYLGYAGGRPAGTVSRVITRDIAGIYAVVTLPEFRHRGFATALTYRAAVDGRAEGCRESYLQATELGRPIYERMGYRLVEEYDEWYPE